MIIVILVLNLRPVSDRPGYYYYYLQKETIWYTTGMHKNEGKFPIVKFKLNFWPSLLLFCIPIAQCLPPTDNNNDHYYYIRIMACG